MYITVLRANKANLLNGAIKTDLTDRNDVHKTMLRMFESSRAENHILYRIRTLKASIMIYIQSDKLADESKIKAEGFEIITTRELNTFVKDISYNILLNPIVKKEGRTLRLDTLSDRKNYVKRKMSEAGLELIGEPTEGAWEDIYFTKEQNGSLRNTLLKGYEYSGKAKITDPVLFNQVVQSGIGKGKNYGLGMLMFL